MNRLVVNTDSLRRMPEILGKPGCGILALEEYDRRTSLGQRCAIYRQSTPKGEIVVVAKAGGVA